MKPTTPLLTPLCVRMKPTTPLRPTTASKTPVSHPQRRWRFQPHAHTSEHRRHRFYARDFRCPQASAGPGQVSQQPSTAGVEGAGGHKRAWLRYPWAVAWPGRTTSRRAEPHPARQAPPVGRAPEGPEGTGGLRGAAPNEVRTPSLAGGRALRRPQHQRGRKHRRKVRTPRSTPGSGRPGGRRGGRVR